MTHAPGAERSWPESKAKLISKDCKSFFGASTSLQSKAACPATPTSPGNPKSSAQALRAADWLGSVARQQDTRDAACDRTRLMMTCRSHPLMVHGPNARHQSREGSPGTLDA